MATSSPMLIAREKAREAVESVHAARDTGELAWNTVKNVGQRRRVPQRRAAAEDARATTAWSTPPTTAPSKRCGKPGTDGVLNTADDEIVPLTDFTREIRITTLNYDSGGGVNPNLRQVRVNVRYKVENAWRTYTLTTYVSSYS